MDFQAIDLHGEWPADVKRMLQDRAGRAFVDGDWVSAATRHSTITVDPSTEDELGPVEASTEHDVHVAVQSAAAAQPGWARLTLSQRSDHIAAMAAKLGEHRELFAALDALDGGLSLKGMLGDVDDAIRQCGKWPSLALAVQGDVFPLIDGNLHYTQLAPYGVVARILPYNHPIWSLVCGILPPLLTGNTVIVKPADQTPLSALAFAELTREVLPAGVVNVLPGGAETGAALVSHPGVPRVAFTGSTATGLAIQRTAATNRIRNVSLELGGKNAMLVFPDVDVDAATQGVLDGMRLNITAGQSCMSSSRVFVHREIYDEFLTRLTERLRQLTVGIAYQPTTDVGPVISRAHADRVQSYVSGAKDDGARVISGTGSAVKLPEKGFYVAPTILADVDPTMRVAREEIFGPVISILPWESRDELLKAANDVEYGLAASVWSNDLTTAIGFAHQVEAGYVWVNCNGVDYFPTPIGGWKNSGVGKEQGIEELRGYLQSKTIHVALDAGRLPKLGDATNG